MIRASYLNTGSPQLHALVGFSVRGKAIGNHSLVPSFERRFKRSGMSEGIIGGLTCDVHHKGYARLARRMVIQAFSSVLIFWALPSRNV